MHLLDTDYMSKDFSRVKYVEDEVLRNPKYIKKKSIVVYGSVVMITQSMQHSCQDLKKQSSCCDSPWTGTCDFL